MLNVDKHTTLLQSSINNDGKNFYSTGPRSLKHKKNKGPQFTAKLGASSGPNVINLFYICNLQVFIIS